MLELWVFDRSGAFSSGMLSLENAPDLLGRVLIIYAMMEDTDLGLNSFLKYDANPECGPYVTFGSLSCFYLRPIPIAAPDPIIGPGTTCYAASRSREEEPSFVVKFSWRKRSDYIELDILERMSERNVQGIIRLANA